MARKGHVLGFGIGIVSGYATLGQVGFEHRREYTANHRRIVAQVLGVVHVLISSKAAEHRLPQQADQRMAAIHTIQAWERGHHAVRKGWDFKLAEALGCFVRDLRQPIALLAAKGGGEHGPI